ncbi:MAG: VOC family protein [Actinobacteria bacterium]|nr:VOC family protein [Actinomycetota bacterium]
MASNPVYDVGPTRPSWTHLALRVTSVDRSVEWYERYTPLRELRSFSDDYGNGAWLADPDSGGPPFVLVLSEFAPERDPFGFAPPTVLGPYAHIGFELPTREAVLEIAKMAEAEGILAYPGTQMQPPIGFICFVEDPDGNTIEFSYDQGTYTIWNEAMGDRS